MTNGNPATAPALSDDLDIFGPMISNPLPAAVMPPAQVSSKPCSLLVTSLLEKLHKFNFEIVVPELKTYALGQHSASSSCNFILFRQIVLFKHSHFY